jgi:hypothetical protein
MNLEKFNFNNLEPKEQAPSSEKSVDETLETVPEEKIEKPEERKTEVEIGEEKKKNREELIELTKELMGEFMVFRFPGIRPEILEKLREEEKEFPGYVTPIDELIKIFTEKGAKISLGDNPKNGNVFILPLVAGVNTEEDSILARSLLIEDGMDERLKKLIELSRK